MKIILSLFLVMFSFIIPLQVNFEEVVKGKISKENIEIIINKKLKKSDCLNNIKDHSTTIIYNFRLSKTIEVEDFISGKFVHYLEPITSKNKFIFQAFIHYNGEIIADYFHGQIYCYENKMVYSKYSELIKRYNNLGIKLIFQIPSTNGSLYFGVKGDCLEIFDLSKNGLNKIDNNDALIDKLKIN